MAERSGSGWSEKFTNFKRVHGVIHHVGSGKDAWAEYDEEDVTQTRVATRGLQRTRKHKPAAEASDPPTAGRPPLGYPQHFTSDPGPHAGYPTWSSQPSKQQSQSHYSGNHNQSSYHYAQQDLTYPPHSSYGPSHQNSAPPPPTSTSYGQGYPPPPASSGPNNYHGSQSSHNNTVSPTSYGSVSNQQDFNSSSPTSQPYNHGYGGYGQHQNDANGTYENASSGTRPDRVASAPGPYGCPYNRPNDGS